MYKSAYQNGAHVEVFTTRAQHPLAGWRISGGATKIFNRESKGFVVGLGQSSHIALPATDRNGLGLV